MAGRGRQQKIPTLPCIESGFASPTVSQAGSSSFLEEKKQEKSEAIQSSAPKPLFPVYRYTSLQSPAGDQLQYSNEDSSYQLHLANLLSPIHMLAGTTSAQLTFPSPCAVTTGLMIPNVANILSTELPAMGKDMYGGIETHVCRIQKQKQNKK